MAMPDDRVTERLGAVTRQVLGDGVYGALLDVLMDGSLKPGSRLSVDALARQLGVSQTPVREALARIEVSGLVVREPMRGYAVAPRMTADELAQLMEARLVVEPHNAALACRRDAAGTADELQQALDAMVAAPVGPGFHGFLPYLKADAEFHEVIGRHCGNKFLFDAWEHFGSHVRRFSVFGDRGVSDSDRAISEHAAILDAFRAGTPDEAAAAMRRHLEGVRDRTMLDLRRRAGAE